MGKLTNYLLLISVLLLLFHFGGLIADTPISYLLDNFLLRPENAQSSNFYLIIWGILAGATTAGVLIGFITHQSPEFYIFLALAPVFFLIGWDLVEIIVQVAQTNRYITLLLFSPLLLVYILSVVEWLRNRD
jgi:hypothetical protein